MTIQTHDNLGNGQWVAGANYTPNIHPYNVADLAQAVDLSVQNVSKWPSCMLGIIVQSDNERVFKWMI